MDVRHALRAQPIIVGIFFVDSATRQIVGGGRIIEADTMEGFISRALGEARDEGEGSSITPSPGPKKRYLPSLPARMRRVGKEARSARMPGPIFPRRPPVAWKNSIHRQPGNRACPSAFLSSPRARLRIGVENFTLRAWCIREADIRRRRSWKSNPRATWRARKTTFEKKSRTISKEGEGKFYTVGKSIWFFVGPRCFTHLGTLCISVFNLELKIVRAMKFHISLSISRR